jgi:hypothetical protein
MNDQDLRDCFAMFAMVGLFMKGIGLDDEGARQCWDAADRMLEARNKVEDDGGITTIKKRKYVRKD